MYLRTLFPPPPPQSPTNFHNIIFRGPEQLDIPDHVMHIDAVTGEKRTRAEFLERVYDGATALGATKDAGGLGFTPDDIVGILSDNCLDYMALVHSLLVLTTPFALFSSYATPRELNHSLTKCKATYMFVHAALLPRFLPAARELGFPEDHIYILEGKSTSSLNLPTFAELVQNVRINKIPREPVREARKDTLAYLVFSSGTSGLPKAVMITHGNLSFSLLQGVLAAQETAKVMNPPPDPNMFPIILGFLPLFHSYGLHYMCLKAPLRPSTVIVMPRWNLEFALSAIPKFRITTVPAVPSIIHQVVNSPDFLKTDFSSIVSFRSGGAYLPPTLLERLRKALPESAETPEGHGISEATISLIARPYPGWLEGRAESMLSASGILLPGLEGMILRPDGTHCLPNETGELYVKGNNISPGYFNDPKATKEAFLPDGWFRTGDLFKANTSGTFWFEGRAKETLKVSGLQVSPAEIEDLLLDEPGGLVVDVAVAGVQTPDARTSDDQSPRAWVVLSARGQQLSEREALEKLEEWTKTNLSKYKWLRGGIQIVREIPKTPTGKVLRRVLQEQYYASAKSARTKL